ncbi:MAG: M28 family peptidase [Clostridia bacterium]|nr:M28 family peptidase [Clostridia bacterium]
MSDWKNIILPKYEVRKTQEQKNSFIEMLRETYGEKMRVEESGKSDKSRNIVFGNPERAKTVFTAHYDTAVYMPLPNFVTPMNLFVYIIYQLLLVALIYLPLVLMIVVASQLTLGLSDTIRIAVNEIILFAYLIAFLLYMRKGPANRHTANDNTSGIVTVLTLLDKLGCDGEYAFILFDNEELGMRGSKAYAAAHPNVKSSKLIINLDCVSDGDNILLYPSKIVKNDSFWKNIVGHAENVFAEQGKVLLVPKGFAFYPSDQTSFKRNIAVAALKKSKVVGYYMDRIHTHRDTEFDQKNIDALVNLFADCGVNE